LPLLVTSLPPVGFFLDFPCQIAMIIGLPITVVYINLFSKTRL